MEWEPHGPADRGYGAELVVQADPVEQREVRRAPMGRDDPVLSAKPPA